jgi:hypothetical protein
MASEAASPSRGRPTVFTDEVLQRAAGFSYARRVRSRRGAQDLVYRMFATAAIEHYCEAFPEKAQTLGWLLRPRRRHTLLTELGRVARPRSGAEGELLWAESEVSVLIEIALEVADKQPSTKEGVAMVRARRRGSA